MIDTKVSLSGHKDYTFLAANFLASITPVVLTDDNSTPGSSQVKVRLIADRRRCGRFLVAPGTDITTVSPAVTNLAFEAATPYQSVAGGSYEVFVTPTGTKTSEFDSGALTLTAGQIRTGVTLDNA